MDRPLLPPSSNGVAAELPDSRQITIVGANGAGKSLFMRKLAELCGDKAYVVSALGAPYPETEPSHLEGSIDDLYAKAIRQRPYLRDGAVSEIDKLTYLLFSDELDTLLELKAGLLSQKGKAPRLPKRSKLDKLRKLWEQIFPGNEILRGEGALVFATDSGDNFITVGKLSHGERTVLYYIGAVLFAMPGAVIFVDNPSLFLHPAILNTVWNGIERLRPDCTFVYDTTDVDFINTRTANATIWVRSHDVQADTWEYTLFAPGELSEDMFVDLMGTRKPVLFIEGDAVHSLDAKLYTLAFPEYTVRPLGSCEKVIEATLSFNDLKPMHHLDSCGIVDRDRRCDEEVEYLRRKRILVPEVAEVENIFLLPDVVRAMAELRGKDPAKTMGKVKERVLRTFGQMADRQALEHVRHRVKHEVECKIDARFKCISAMEIHLSSLVERLRPREQFNSLRAEFRRLAKDDDYCGVLRVFNYKPMLADSEIHRLLGYKNKENYTQGVLDAIKEGGKAGDRIRQAVRCCFGIMEQDPTEGQLVDGSDIKRRKETSLRDQSRRQGKRYHRGKRL